MIDALASAEHYWQHLAPIWRQLEAHSLAGAVYGARSTDRWATTRSRYRGALGALQPVMVASYVDFQRTYPAPVVYVEHGAGQTYDGDRASAAHPSYSGGAGFERVVLFVCPSEQVAVRWARRYPSTPTAVVGCPRLDEWHDRRVATEGSGGSGPRSRPRTLAVAFHWDCGLVPETLSAWRHYDRALPQLVEWARARDVELLGHGHPRIWRHLRERWVRLGVEPVERLDDVFERAGLLIADNTSAMFEFASLDRPVVVLNAPWYRRDVEHGGRFWSWANVGLQVDAPVELPATIERALSDEPAVRASRQRIVAEVYGYADGQASARAAAAIVEVAHHADKIHRGRDTPNERL